MPIFRRSTKMGDKDARLWISNYIQKRETKCGGRCTFKKTTRRLSITLFYFYYTSQLDRNGKDVMEEWPKEMDSRSTTTKGSYYIG